jgi:beta-N-acetylhexosaminidase
MNDLIQNVGQMLCIGLEGQECGPELRGLLREIRPGGVIFFQRNIATEEQFRKLVADIRETLKDSQPFLAIDQEGGQVDRFRELLGPLPSARDAAQTGLAYEVGELAGRELAAFGLNVDFAPVLDIGSSESEAVLGTRTAGNSPREVTEFSREFMRGLAAWNITGCGKHFPGLGAGRKDSHIGMPVIESTRQELWGRDLQPYVPHTQRFPMIMVAHAWYPELERALDADSPAAKKPTPASLSPNIVAMELRRGIGHMGLVVCDDLEMGGVLEGRSIEEAGVAAVRAGCEVLLVCRHAENVQRVHAAVMRQGERDAAFRDQVGEAARRILSQKQPPSPSAGAHSNFVDWAGLRRDIHLLSEKVRERSGTLGARNDEA